MAKTFKKKWRRWVLEITREPGTYLYNCHKKYGDGWGPSHLSTENIFEAERFHSREQARSECDPRNSDSLARGWSSDPGALRPVEIEIHGTIKIV